MAQIVGTAFLKILLQIAKNRVIYYIKAIILHLNVIFSPITLKIAESRLSSVEKVLKLKQICKHF